MVKKRTIRQKIRQKHAKTSQEADDAEATTSGQHEGEAEEDGPRVGDTPRVRRKVVKQMRFLDRLQKTQQVLAAKATLGKKRRRRGSQLVGLALSSLADLGEALPSTSAAAAGGAAGADAAAPARKAAFLGRAPKVVRTAARQRITTEETKQLAAVMSHPVFKANPFAAIQQHLTNTLPPPPPRDPPKKGDQKGKKRKKGKRKETLDGGGPETMDMA